MDMERLLLIPLISLTVYLLFVYFKYGMTKSISATYKVIRGWERPLFTVTLWLVAIPIMMVGIENVPNNWPEVLFFLAGGGICLVGAAPKFWVEKMEYTAHMIGSYGGIGLGMIACLVYYFSVSTLILVGGYALFVISQMAMKATRIKNYTYWVEVVAVIVVCTVLYLNQQ